MLPPAVQVLQGGLAIKRTRIVTLDKGLTASTSGMAIARPRAHGKFIFLGDKKLYDRGTTYGTFRPAEDGGEYDPKVVDQDFARMASHGLNAVRTCAGHPAVLCYAIGNEIPASIVRWHGRRRVENYLERLYRAAKEEDPEALVTYVNYPSTEYLSLPFVDLFCFNVYLESRERLDAYLARLQNIAGDRPLVMAEIGLDSRRNGEERQAETLAWQI